MSEQLLLKELSRYDIGTFADIIYRNALLYPDNEAFVYESIRITHFEYNAMVNKVIHALFKMGVKKGETIGLLSWNCVQAAVIYGVAMKGGFIASPFNPRLTADELEYLITYSETDTLFVGPELVDTINRLKPRLPGVRNYIILEGSADDMVSFQELLESNPGNEPDLNVGVNDLIGIIYTSGTTGVPRGALYTNSCFISDCSTFALDVNVQQIDRHLQVTPQFHIAGNTWFRTFLYAGACTVIHKFFNPAEVLNTIQEEKITHMNIVPTQLVAMLNVPNIEKYDLNSMKLIWYGASPMPSEVLKKGLDVFGNVFGQGYGQSESGPAITHMPKEDHMVVNIPGADQKHLLSAGKPDIGVQVRIVDEDGNDCARGYVGEIIVKSRHIMVGYWKKPEDTKDTIIDGWLHTGDMGYYDENGYIYIADRKKDMIITGGENVFPREVEEVLYQHPAVHEAAVIGIPDPYWVEKVHAVLAPKKGQTIDEEEIIAFCKQRIAGYKTPKSIEIVPELPKNAAGKIVKKELRAKFAKK
ncbi:MAG: long-chain-fatty-acid--CoA ligase [Firmicutes bacterium]|nr:long-chain-fatty-acid--CoA ligase [Bacillota bacterium]